MYDVVMKKDPRNGWEAKTLIQLPGLIEKGSARLPNEEPAPAYLEITTSKNSNGGIRTHAYVGYKTAHGFRTAISFARGTYAESGGDYSRSVRSNPKFRCTEKSVRDFHAESLNYVDALLSAVAMHYGIALPALTEGETVSA